MLKDTTSKNEKWITEYIKARHRFSQQMKDAKVKVQGDMRASGKNVSLLCEAVLTCLGLKFTLTFLSSLNN